MNLAPVIERLIAGSSLSEKEAFALMEQTLAGQVPPAQVAAFLVALRAKEETANEIAGFVRAMRETMQKVASNHLVVLDTCGTGGDGKGTFNISTACAFVVAGAGVAVAKHGNRSVSSHCGSADVLEAAGVKIDKSLKTAEACLNEIGIAFFFAPQYHPAMKNVAPVRKELGIRTIFNLLGPLANPAGVNAQIIGVPRPEFVPRVAEVLKRLHPAKFYSGLVLHESGHDELVLGGKCSIAEVEKGKIRSYTVGPKDFGIKVTKNLSLAGGDAPGNAKILREILSGGRDDLRTVVTANAALALYCSEKVRGNKTSLKENFEKAAEAISSGKALEKLDLLIEWSHKTF